MPSRIRAFDWSRTPLGPMAHWPQSLRTVVELCLNSRLPTLIWWGPQLVNLYNDAYAPILGLNHPRALGEPAKRIWVDTWPHIEKDLEGLLRDGVPVLKERVRFVLQRSGAPEERFFTYAQTPLRDEAGRIAGLMQICTDETARVLAERERDGLAAQRQLALDAARLGWWRYDPETKLATYDRRYTEIFEVSGEARPDEELLKRIHPDDAAEVQAKVEAALDPARAAPYSAQYRLLLPDGSTRWVEAHGLATFAGEGKARKATSLVGTVADISERLRIDDQARTILESITDAFFAVDARWRFTYVNRKAAQVLGTSSAELLGRSLWDAYPGLKGSPFERIYRDAMTRGLVGQATSYYPDHQRWYEVHAYPGALGISIYFRDVTDKARADEALRDSTALLRGISDSTGDVIYAKDRQGRFRYANPATLALLGRPLEQVLGQTDEVLIGDKAAAKRVMENDRQIMESGRAADMEEVVPLPDGTRKVWLSRKMPDRDAGGKVVGLLGVSREITDEKRAWERINALYAVSAALSEAITPEDVARVTVNQGIAAVGAMAGSLALVTQDGQFLEMVGWVGFTPEAMEPWRRFPLSAPVPIAEAARTGAPVFTESPAERAARFPAVARFNEQSGTRSGACVPLTIAGRAVGALGLSFARAGPFSTADREFLVSLGRQCAQALERARLIDGERRARAEAERASRMKDEFLATLSHELRTPLNAMLGWATILTRKVPPDSDVGLGLEKILRNARAQAGIIDDLLDMSRIVSGTLSLALQRLELAQVLQAAMDTVRPAADAKGVGLRAAVVDAQIGVVSGDPSRLQQAFWNLLHNAVKFTPAGGRVEVSLARDAGLVRLTIADSGEGISPEFLPQVFDRFTQADASPTRQHGGLGLGLSIVKQLVELHGGTVRAESPGVGRGSTFTVELPLARIEGEPAQPLEPRTRDGGPLRMPLAGLKLLVVDDEPDARTLLQHLLEDNQAVVRLAGTAAEALAALRSERPDVLISDIGMPGEDGYALIKKLRALSPGDGGDLPAIALTAYARAEDRSRALRAGFQSHVAKPVDPTELVTVIASLALRPLE